MDLSLFDYDLPRELIAQFPSRRRDQSRLLVLDRSSGETRQGRFRDILDYIKPGDALVVNNTRVFKARLLGRRQSGGKVEIFLVRRVEPESERWLALVSPSRRLKEGEVIPFDRNLTVQLEKSLGSGQWEVLFSSARSRERVIARHGHVPLPHYIARSDERSDLNRYQTIFADRGKTGAVAAPTAGFHFTPSLRQALEEAGVTVVELTLHVGPGTFKPITVDNVEEHTVDPEWSELSAEAAATLNRVRAAGGKVFAVGTTSVRTLESAPISEGEIQPFSGMVDLYIKPGFTFQVVDHLITNFHLPKSSLLVLVSAFAGRERILQAYVEAVASEYRFYSYGDAMLIV
ncbi:tRNA preQ1(34) S-adenosylmethionine ribosyltransferase-isomerase QueA [candidate division GN15 bacterium]|nr:tRNA preQ1(34) S-adenosylmethionine ribosyltransferase-isomerase QueA [candidate division GN15 bacterium]